jgi:hypothetical protein
VRARVHSRLPFVTLAVGTIALGLTVHRGGAALGLGPVVRDVLGDALWAVMIAWWLGVLAPTMRLTARAGVALAICAAVEVSQLLHTPALDAARRTLAGRLMLGSGFDPRDLVAHAAGVLAAGRLERAVSDRRRTLRPA